ncbi:MAG: Gfo/Idh/MocA family oxidoreductase [Bacteroidota bacterium]|nr:Gfo/Idh/MocA family oxidoreductase [Bacteroidota bacterium]
MDVKLKLGLIGVGHLGKIHLTCILQLPQIDFIGFYDENVNTRENISAEFNVRAFHSIEELLSEVDAVDIVTPTNSHFTIAAQAIQAGKHCFIEKPVTSTLGEARELKSLLTNLELKLQVGHVERFNPAFLSAKGSIHNPKFIEAHRLATFNPRGTDVSVVHDLMIHDLDLISLMAKSEIKELRASGVSIVSKQADICNARIEFENGLVANVTASRISMKQMRKIRIFQEDAYISLDLMKKESQLIKLLDEPMENVLELETFKGKKYISLENPKINPVNAILEEIRSFYQSIVNNTQTEVNLDDGIRALTLVHAIVEQIERPK